MKSETKEKISEAITKILGVEFSDISGRTYQRRVNYARDMFCYFIRKETDATFAETGLLLDRNRSTAYDSVAKIEGLRSAYNWVEDDINNIESELK